VSSRASITAASHASANQATSLIGTPVTNRGKVVPATGVLAEMASGSNSTAQGGG
jgi:hypothetical protein